MGAEGLHFQVTGPDKSVMRDCWLQCLSTEDLCPVVLVKREQDPGRLAGTQN